METTSKPRRRPELAPRADTSRFLHQAYTDRSPPPSAGSAIVELRDADGQPIPGFTLADCEEIGGSSIDQLVYWKGQCDVGTLEGRPIRVYMKLKRAKLYSFQFVTE